MGVKIKGKGVLNGTILIDQATKKPKCHRFTRVPYALPPTGARRWRKPEPLPSDYSYGTENHPGKFIRPSSLCPQLALPGLALTGFNEDCLQSNIFVPLGEPPKNGWPVFVYIHGGFLQLGSNSWDDPSLLLSDTNVKCIIVSPNYRIGILGFLASKEVWGTDSPAANFGFWDQRLAIEWAYDNIEYFGGDKNNITVGGLSAGAYSAFHQLAHDVGPNSTRQIIRRVFQWSNGCGVQPKQLPETQPQFEELLNILEIPTSLSGTEKMEVLREKSHQDLTAAVGKMSQKFFRPILDGDFMAEDLFANMFSGKLGARMKELDIKIMIGDLTQEFNVYKNIWPPQSFSSLVDRLSWDYPRHVVEDVCAPYKPNLTASKGEWTEIFGKIYADMQVHSTERGLVECLAKALPLENIFRYRIDWRTKSVDKRYPKDFGPTHGTDLSIWFYGNGEELTESEKPIIKAWLEPMGQFLRGEDTEWGTKEITDVRYLTSDGEVVIKKDDEWDNKLALWETTKEVSKSGVSLKL